MSAAWKYVYWLDQAQLEQLKARLSEQGIALAEAKKNACEILLSDIGYAPPSVWQVICRFDAEPWYEQSAAAGKYAVAASQPLGPDLESCLAATITPVDFTPPAMPSKEARQSLIDNKEFRQRVPAKWWSFPAETGAAIVAGLQKMFGSQVANFDELHRSWTAAHANFVCPCYRSGPEHGNAAYSVAESVHISSCCVEMFNMLGSREPMLVRPCVGGVIVKAFEKDRYYRVTPAGAQ